MFNRLIFTLILLVLGNFFSACGGNAEECRVLHSFGGPATITATGKEVKTAELNLFTQEGCEYSVNELGLVVRQVKPVGSSDPAWPLEELKVEVDGGRLFDYQEPRAQTSPTTSSSGLLEQGRSAFFEEGMVVSAESLTSLTLRLSHATLGNSVAEGNEGVFHIKLEGLIGEAPEKERFPAQAVAQDFMEVRVTRD